MSERDDLERAPRLLEEGATPFERDLLESWSSEQPSAGSKARALAIAGAAAGTLAAATAATGVVGAGGSKAATFGLAMAVKWGFLFVVVTAAAVATVVVVKRSRSDDAAMPTVVSASPPAATGAAMSTATATAATATTATTSVAATAATEPKTLSPADLPAATAAAATAAAATGATAASASSAATSLRGHGATGGASLSEEIGSFDRAREALDSGDADRALVLVDAYERRFPAGTFLQEAEVLRIQALTRKGDTAGARRVGQRFLAAHPTSPHAARIRAILDASNP